MQIDCPNCHTCNYLEGIDLPDNVCDDNDYECIECFHVFSIGWTAEAEVRDDKLN